MPSSPSLEPLTLRCETDSTYDSRSRKLLIVSGATEKACQRFCSRLAKYLVVKRRRSEDPNTLLTRLAYTLEKQTLHNHRIALNACDLDDLISQLNSFAHVPVPRREKKKNSRIAFVFSGQGAQYAQMGYELLKSYPTFFRSIKQAREQLARLGCAWDLMNELSLTKNDSRVNEPAFSQPMSTAIQLALIDVLIELGASPCAVMGHSSGEISAAYAAKAISLESAMTIAYFRGLLTSELMKGNVANTGAMIAVGSSSDMVDQYIGKVGTKFGRMNIACYNSPSSVTVSGDNNAVNELKAILDFDGIFNRKLMTNGAAYHSHQMKLIEREYAVALDELSLGSISSSVRMFSSVTGKDLDEGTRLDGKYWVKNLLSPVLFSQALSEMCQSEYDGVAIDTIIEIGPHSQLEGPVKQTLKTLPEPHKSIAYTHTLKRNKDAEESLLQCFGFVHIQNGSVNIHDLNECKQFPSQLPDLPPYPFDHDRTYWHESRISKDYRHRKHLPHELLGNLSLDVNPLEPRWRRFLSLNESPWLRSHIVQGQVTFPAAGYITMAAQAIKQNVYAKNHSIKVGAVRFRNINIGNALVLSEDMGDLEITLSLRPQARTARESSDVWSEFRIFTVNSEQKWTEHCRGLIQAETEQTDHLALSPEDIPWIDLQCTHQDTAQKFYHVSHGLGLEWKAPFNNLSSIRTSQSSSIATVETPEIDESSGGMGDLMHPAFLDASLFHGILSILFLRKNPQSTHVPSFIKQLRITNRPTTSNTKLKCTSQRQEDSQLFDVLVQDHSGPAAKTSLEAEGIRMTCLPGAVVNQSRRELCHGIDWVTYTDSWSLQNRKQLSTAVAPPGSIATVDCVLEKLALYYIQKTLREIEAAEVMDTYFRKYFEWMQTLAREETAQQPPHPEEVKSLDLGPIGEAIECLGPNMPSIITGRIHPLSLLTQNDLLSRLYTDGTYPRCYAQMSAYCRELGRQKAGLRVLEIGGGTASATVPILQAMNGGKENSVRRYDFTDLSPGFHEAAKQRLGDLAECVEFGVLDLERDAMGQGYSEAAYDLIVACNVVHATKEINKTLQNVRQLLKPGGKFMLLELTRNTIYNNLVFGVFEGWWAGYEEGRRQSPLLTPPEWITRLRAMDLVISERWFEDYEETNGGTMSVFIASAPTQHAVEPLGSVHVVTTEDNQSEIPIIQNHFNTLEGSIFSPAVSARSLSIPPNEGYADVVIMLPEVAKRLCSSPSDHVWQQLKYWISKARIVLFISNAVVENLCGIESSTFIGFARTLRLEYPNTRFVTLSLLSPNASVLGKLSEVLPVLLNSPTFDLRQKEAGIEKEFAERDGQLYVLRAFHRPKLSDFIHRSCQEGETEMVPFLQPERTLTAKLGIPGLLESIRWQDDIDKPKVGPDDVCFELRAASINFKDVLIATGQLDGITQMQNDCSGVVLEVGENMKHRFKPGDHVCALYSRSYTNYPVVNGDCCQVVPKEISFAEAASLPVVWATVYYSLVYHGRLSKGEKVLIHSAAGAVGQAAVSLAQYLGAEIYVTVGNNSKRNLLHDKYGIPHTHIFSSRTTSFHSGVKRLTKGHGVDVVLNSLSGEMFRESCNLVAPFGRFVEIGRKDLMDDALMPMQFLLRNVTFAYVDLTMVMEQNKQLARRLLESAVDLAVSRKVQPVTLSIMPISDIETGFRRIQTREHTGKIILVVEREQRVKVRKTIKAVYLSDKVSERANTFLQATPALPTAAQFKQNASYVIVGGMGGLGQSIISWMASHGAKTIFSLSRSGIKDQQTLSFIEGLRAQGVELHTKKCDVSIADDVYSFLKENQRLGFPPVRGVIQSAMVLRVSKYIYIFCRRPPHSKPKLSDK